MITPAYSFTATERVLPSLALDFTTAVLDPRVVITRALNTATRVNSSGFIETVNADLPRFDYNPVTLACRGLLIEQSRANLFLQSQTFATTWAPTRASIATVSSTSPAGASTVDQIVEDTSANSHFIGQTVNPVAGNATVTLSLFAKPAGRNFLTFTTQDSSGAFKTSYFNVSNGTIGTVASGHTASIQAFPNGWYRCIVVTTQAATSGVFRFYPGPADVNGSNSYQGNGTSGILVWGAQFEVGAFVTSYIPTTTTSLTRNADVAAMTGTNFSSWFNGSAGTFVGQWDSVTGAASMLTTAPSAGGSGALLYSSSFDIKSYNGTNVAQTSNFYSVNTAFRAGVAYDANGRSVCLNGGTVGTNTGVITAPTSLSLGAGSISGILNGHTYKLFYYPQRLTNAELQAFSK